MWVLSPCWFFCAIVLKYVIIMVIMVCDLYLKYVIIMVCLNWHVIYYFARCPNSEHFLILIFYVFCMNSSWTSSIGLPFPSHPNSIESCLIKGQQMNCIHCIQQIYGFSRWKWLVDVDIWCIMKLEANIQPFTCWYTVSIQKLQG